MLQGPTSISRRGEEEADPAMSSAQCNPSQDEPSRVNYERSQSPPSRNWIDRAGGFAADTNGVASRAHMGDDRMGEKERKPNQY